MRILPIIFLVACVALQTSAQDEGDTRAAPARSLLKRGSLANKGKTTTTTTVAPPPQEEAEYDEEAEYSEGEAQQEASTSPPPSSSTEGKKLNTGGVRPFRSNTDLLETLKKRRQQAAEAKLNVHSSTTTVSQDEPTEPPVKANFGGSNKKRFNTGKSEISNDASAAKPTRSRFGKSISAKSNEDLEEIEAPAPVKPSRFSSRRGGN